MKVLRGVLKPQFLVLIGLLISACDDTGKNELQTMQRPNVVFFLIDDLGYSDLGCYGSEFYETPAIDKLANEGIRFTQNYAASTICSPTRASILTGKYPGRLHITGPIPIYGAERRENPKMKDADYVMDLPLEEVTIGDAFKAAGYTTASIGKWHVGHHEEYYPQHNGFDYNIAGSKRGGPGNYFYPYQGKWRMTPEYEWEYWNTFPDGEEGEYLTDRLTDEAIKIIEKHKDEPFFVYLSHYAVHSPLQAKQKYIDKYAKKEKDSIRGHVNAKYATMIQSVDESVQKVTAKLESLGLADNTIMVIASDNGGADFATSNWPWRGNKGNFYEGGIRVPLIIKWAGKVPNGKQIDMPVITNDYYPTLLELCGLPMQPEQHLDGMSFANQLLDPKKGQSSFYQRDIFWHFPNYIGAVKTDATNPCTVIRSGDWKMIEWLEDYTVELYNLHDDPKEANDLSVEHPDLVKELKEKLQKHREETEVQYPRPNPDYIESM
ncbi:MAG: sulfatase [Cytophagales bacterium]|nr:sulfatase [Cytophagales bacterium]